MRDSFNTMLSPFGLTLDPRAMSPFIISRGEGEDGAKESTRPRFLPAPHHVLPPVTPPTSPSGINLIAVPLVMPLPPVSHFLLFLRLFCSGLLAVSVCLSVCRLCPHSVCLLFQDNRLFYLFFAIIVFFVVLSKQI